MMMEIEKGSHSKKNLMQDKCLAERETTLVEIRNTEEIFPYIGKAFLSSTQVEKYYYKYVGTKGFSVRKGTIVKVRDLLKKRILFNCKE